jgi:type IV secretory pathway VirB10-like protein
MPDPIQTAPIKDKSEKPEGVLSRRTQHWIYLAVAVVMVTVIALSGNKTPKEKKTPVPPPPPPVVDPNKARIEEYRKRIEEQAQKLAIEQAQLARTKAALNPSAGEWATQPGQGFAIPPAPAFSPAGYGAYGPPNPERSAVQQDKEKREYFSRFAPVVVLTRRKNAPSSVQPPPAVVSPMMELPALPMPSVANAYGYPYQAPSQPNPNAGQTAAGTPTSREQSESAKDGDPVARADRAEERTKSGPQGRGTDLNRADGKTYRVFEGTVIECVLTNRMDGHFSGPVNCMVTTPIYSRDRQRLLIPRGSRVLGEVRKVDTFGQQRLAVVFHRLIMPDGYSVNLDKFQGLNQIGETGLRDQVNHHYLQVFGVSVAIGAIAGLSQSNTRYGFDTSATDAYRQGVATSLSQSSLRILDRYLNVLPTFTIREGHRVKIYLSDDLALPAYDRHRMPIDL